MAYPLLQKCYKGVFPFRLGTTSYIYPDQIVPNVAKLAPFLDEIELVLFESEGQDNYPGEMELRDMMNFCLKGEVSFNIHLPIDLFLGDKNEEIRSRGVSVVKRVINRTLCLKPSLYTLHFDLRDKNGREESDIDAWRGRIIRSASEITKWGIEPSRISIETLSYPFEWIEDIVREFGFSICLDIGHLLVSRQEIARYLENYLSKTSIIHLHGVENGVDHLGIDRLNGKMVDLIVSKLQRFTGVLSVEVFSFEDLKNSLEVLEQRWEKN
jgi:sugar phosphate isomerase/epimerase